jgi:hypothetical protein
VIAQGKCPGLTLEDVQLTGFTHNGLSLWNCDGSGDKNSADKITLSRCRFTTDKPKAAALLITGNKNVQVPNSDVVVKDCRFEGPFQGAVVIDDRTKQLDFSRNRFFQNAIGFMYKKGSPRYPVSMSITSNTFSNLMHFLYFEDAPNFPDNSTMVVKNNLFSRCASLASLRHDPAKKQPEGFAGHWIWFPDAGEPFKSAPPGKRTFRKTFNLTKPVTQAHLDIGADDKFTVWINGSLVGENAAQRVLTYNVTRFLKQGANVIAVLAENTGPSPAGLIVELDFQYTGSPATKVGSDASWKTSDAEPAGWQAPGFDDNAWQPAKDLGTFKVGHVPWKVWLWDAAVWSSAPKEFKASFFTLDNNVRDPYSAEGNLNLGTTIVDFPQLPSDPSKPDFLMYPAGSPLSAFKVGVTPQ